MYKCFIFSKIAQHGFSLTKRKSTLIDFLKWHTFKMFPQRCTIFISLFVSFFFFLFMFLNYSFYFLQAGFFFHRCSLLDYLFFICFFVWFVLFHYWNTGQFNFFSIVNIYKLKCKKTYNHQVILIIAAKVWWSACVRLFAKGLPRKIRQMGTPWKNFA